MILPNLDDLPGALNDLRLEAAASGWTLHDAEDGFGDDERAAASAGYRDLALHLRSPEGVVTELQIHVNEMWEAKFERGHAIYEEIRELQALGRDLTAAEERRLARLRWESIELYSAAWEAALGARRGR